jgi:hypothetical protein
MSRYRINVEEYHKQQSYHDEAGYTVTWEQHPNVSWFHPNDKETADKLCLEMAQFLASKIDGGPNGSSASIGVVWSNKVEWNTIENGYNVFIRYPIGD